MAMKREYKPEKPLTLRPETEAIMRPITAQSFDDLLRRAVQVQEKKPAPKSK